MKRDQIQDIIKTIPKALPAGIPYIGPVMESIRVQLSEEEQKIALDELKEKSGEQLGMTREIKEMIEHALIVGVSQEPSPEQVEDFPQLSLEVDEAWINRPVQFAQVSGKRKFSCLIIKNNEAARYEALECRAMLELVDKPQSTQKYHSLHWADTPFEPVQTAKPIDIGIGMNKRLDIVFKPVKESPVERGTIPDGATGPAHLSKQLATTSGYPFVTLNGEALQIIHSSKADAYLDHNVVKLDSEPEGCWIAEPYSLYLPSIGNQNYLPQGNYFATLIVTYKTKKSTPGALHHKIHLVSPGNVGKLDLKLLD